MALRRRFDPEKLREEMRAYQFAVRDGDHLLSKEQHAMQLALLYPEPEDEGGAK